MGKKEQRRKEEEKPNRKTNKINRNRKIATENIRRREKKTDKMDRVIPKSNQLFVQAKHVHI